MHELIYHRWGQSPHNYAAHYNMLMQPWWSCWCQCVVTQRITTCSCSLGVLAGARMLWHSALQHANAALVVLLVSVCCDTVHYNMFMQPWWSCWCQCVVTQRITTCSCSLGVLAGVRMLWHSALQHANAALVFLLVSEFCDTGHNNMFMQPWRSCWCQCVVTQRITTCSCSLGVLAGVSVLWHSALQHVHAALVFLLVSVCCDTAHYNMLMQHWCSCWYQCVVTQRITTCSCSLGVHALVFLLVSVCCDTAHYNMLMQPWCSCWCQCVVTQCITTCSYSLGVLAGVSVLWHSALQHANAALVFLLVSVCCDTAHYNMLMQHWCSCWCQCVVTQCITTCSCSLGVLAGVSVLWHRALQHANAALVFLLVSVCCDTAHYNMLMQPWCSCWCQCVVTQCITTCSCSLGVLAGVSVLWHSALQHANAALVFLLVSVCCDTAHYNMLMQPWCSCWCQCVVTQRITTC